MSVVFRDGDLFKSKSQTLVNPVNCFGVMGRGVALKFKKYFPEMFDDYVIRCKSGGVQVGQPYLYKDSSPWIVNFPTKHHWRDEAKIKYIEIGLDYLFEHYEEWGITSLASPALGCGLGGLDWFEVSEILQAKFDQFIIPVEVFNPVYGFRMNGYE